MVDLIRGQQRSYIPDKTSAIKRQQIAQNLSEGKQFLSEVTDLAKGLYKLNVKKDKQLDDEASKRADADLKAHQGELDAKIFDLQNQYGENIISDKGQKAVRETIGEHFRQYRPAYEDTLTGSKYDAGADAYINKTLDSNYLFAAKSKFTRQNAERKAAEKMAAESAKKQAQNAQNISKVYVDQAGELGKYGANTDLQSLLQDQDKILDKAIKDVPQMSKDAAKATAREAAVRNYVLNSITSDDQDVAKQMDLALHNQEEFNKVFPEEYTAPLVAQAKDIAERNMNLERANLINEQMDVEEKSPRAKELKKKIKEIDKKIEKLKEDNVIEVDGKKQDFDDVVKNQIRESLANDLEPMARQQLGEQALIARQEAQQAQKEDAALGATDIFNPSFKLDLIRKADEEAAKELWLGEHQDTIRELSLTPQAETPAELKFNNEQKKASTKTGEPNASLKLDLIRLANQESENEPQMSYINDEKPKGFWQEFRDNYLGFVDNMSHVSPLTYTDINVQGNANAMIKQLTYEQLESPTGDPSEFEYKCFKTLFDISKLEMSQEDRVNAQNAVAKLMLSQDSDVLELRALLESGEVGIIPTKEKTGWEIVAKLRGYETGTVQGFLAAEPYVLDAFDKRMYHAQQKYQTLAVNMWANGATYDQVMNERNKIFKDEVDGFYREFHLTNLAELDEKLRNHEPAFAKFNGITYEYKGRGPDQRPIWYDHAVLNTNRDFSRFFERKPMKDPNKKSE